MSSERNSTAIGFLTVVRHEPHGLFGGYLLLNRNGRPLEFHCTAPVKPNRAQEILYGATLESYLYGEAIGATLTAKSSTPIDFLCVDVQAALAIRDGMTRLHGSYGTAFRAPSLYELYDPSAGDTELRPQESSTWDLGQRSELTEWLAVDTTCLLYTSPSPRD